MMNTVTSGLQLRLGIRGPQVSRGPQGPLETHLLLQVLPDTLGLLETLDRLELNLLSQVLPDTLGLLETLDRLVLLDPRGILAPLDTPVLLERRDPRGILAPLERRVLLGLGTRDRLDHCHTTSADQSPIIRIQLKIPKSVTLSMLQRSPNTTCMA